MAEKSLVNDEALMDGVEAAVVAVPAAVVADPLGAAVVALDDDFFELLQPRRPIEAMIATDITAARLRGTDIRFPLMEMILSVRRALPGADHEKWSRVTLRSFV
jgi:hypothetical protein